MPLIVLQICYIICFIPNVSLLIAQSSVKDRVDTAVDSGLALNLKIIAEQHLAEVCVEVMWNYLPTGVFIM